ncbi:MAG TPA: TIM44-like domain-containing protein [Solirubrobacteraceae bacterium]|jgi:predicted lipid-binding transport protein (Tim44 family)
MRKRAPLLLIGLAVLALALIAAPEALAAAGGGSSGFGGGGEGGGGKGAAFYIIIQLLIRIAFIGHGLGVLILVGLFLLWILFTRVIPRTQAARAGQTGTGPAARRRTAQRERRVEAAAAEAAEDDPAFATDNVKPAAAKLFKDIQVAWDAGDREWLRRLVAPQLLREWELRLDDFARRGWHNRVQCLGEPAVEYVGLTHHGERDSDRVVVRIEARLRDFVEDPYGNRIRRADRLGETTRIREFWTLVRGAGGKWMLGSIEQGAEGQHALSEQIVATPWSDEQGMRDEALVEGAVAEALPEDVKPAEVAKLDFDGDAHAAANDLSLADGRFAPDVLEVAARRAVGAWAQAIDGGKAKLDGIAIPEVIPELLHPGDPAARTRVVIRGPQVKRLTVVGLDPEAEPPTMTVDVDVEARRYVEDRDTAAVVSGSRTRTAKFTQRWTFALNGDDQEPWRIVAVGAPLTAG